MQCSLNKRLIQLKLELKLKLSEAHSEPSKISKIEFLQKQLAAFCKNSQQLNLKQTTVFWFFMGHIYFWDHVLTETFSDLNFVLLKASSIWEKVFKNGPSTICGRQPLKIWRGICSTSSRPYPLESILEYFLPFVVFNIYFFYLNQFLASGPSLHPENTRNQEFSDVLRGCTKTTVAWNDHEILVRFRM